MKRKRETPEDTGSTKKRKAGAEEDAKKGKKEGDREYGVSRGIDFVDVACVVNFDLPQSSRGYTHRVGRTARAGRSGMALSFISTEPGKEDQDVFERIERDQNGWTKSGGRGAESKLKEWEVDSKLVLGFRYRMEDALRSVTGKAVKEARIKELKNEILNSDKLKVGQFVSKFHFGETDMFFARLILRTTHLISNSYDTTSLYILQEYRVI